MNKEKVIAEVIKTARGDSVVVTLDETGAYAVYRNEVKRHYPCSTEDVIRALAFYMETSC